MRSSVVVVGQFTKPKNNISISIVIKYYVVQQLNESSELYDSFTRSLYSPILMLRFVTLLHNRTKTQNSIFFEKQSCSYRYTIYECITIIYALQSRLYRH